MGLFSISARLILRCANGNKRIGIEKDNFAVVVCQVHFIKSVLEKQVQFTHFCSRFGIEKQSNAIQRELLPEAENLSHKFFAD